MKKLLAMILCVFMLSGCVKEAEQTTGLFPDTSTAETTTASTEAEEIISELGLSDLKQMRDRNIKGMVFDGEEIYSDAALFMADDGRADAVGIFYVSDLETAREDIENFLSDLKADYTTYSSSERFKIDNAALADNGTDKICLIICDDVEAADKAAAEYVS